MITHYYRTQKIMVSVTTFINKAKFRREHQPKDFCAVSVVEILQALLPCLPISSTPTMLIFGAQSLQKWV